MGFFLNGQQPRAPSLRDLLAGPEPIVAPGAYDALSARLIEAAGFRAVYMTGFGTAASLLGRPDVGLLGMSEMVDNARRIVQAVAVPVIADADVIFFEAPQTEEEIETVAAEFSDVPLLFNWAEGGKTPPISFQRLRALGFRIIIFPISTLLAATRGIREVLETIRADGTPVAALSGLPRFGEFTDFIGLPEIQELEQRFSSLPVQTRS